MLETFASLFIYIFLLFGVVSLIQGIGDALMDAFTAL